jgi:hypothetical protein
LNMDDVIMQEYCSSYSAILWYVKIFCSEGKIEKRSAVLKL